MIDMISRSAVMEMAFCAIKPTHDCQSVVSVVNVEDIENIPAIDAVPVVHGHWIHDINNLYGCSECRARETMSHKKKKNYCPNCGANMDGEAE